MPRGGRRSRGLGGGGFDVDRRGLDAEVGRDVGGHARHVRRHARRLREDGGVDVQHLELLRSELVRHVAQQPGCRRPRRRCRCRGSAGRCRPGRPRRAARRRSRAAARRHRNGRPALVVRDLDAAHHQLAPRDQRMHVEALPDPHARLFRMLRRSPVLRPGHLEVFAAAGHQPRLQAHLLDRGGFVGRRALARSSACRSKPARNICGVCASQSRERSVAATRCAPLSSLAALFTVSAIGSARIPPTSSFCVSRTSASRSLRGRQAARRRAPASSRRPPPPHRRHQPVVHRIAARFPRRRRAARARRTRSSRARRTRGPPARAPRTPIPPAARNCSHRMPASAARRAAGIALALPPKAGYRAGGGISVKRHRSSFNSGRYNYIGRPSDAPRFASCPPTLYPARRPADALALARLAQAEKPLAVITATALDAQRLVDEVRWFAPQCASACCRTGKRCPTTSSRRTRTRCPSASRRFIASSAATSTSPWCRRRRRWCACARRPISPGTRSSSSRRAALDRAACAGSSPSRATST